MKPILFNTEMVQAILEGRKTVTRRVVKPQPNNNQHLGMYGWKSYVDMIEENEVKFKLANSPYTPYKVGDILYVRETFNDIETDSILYAADKDFIDFGCKEVDGFLFMESEIKWKPSIHMPKAAARIFLKVTSVRVEKLQNINCPEAEKEGCTFLKEKNSKGEFLTERGVFKELWDSTIKKQDIDEYGWEANPWVWVIEFERVEVEDENIKN